eukprot:jgi/Ulvmu1/3162/UM015_0202.1
MDGFQGHSETFYNTTLVDDSGSDDVSLNLSIDGLKVMDRAGRLTKRKIPLEQITRWTRNSDRLTMFVKTSADLEEKAVSFYSTSATLTSLLDSLTSFCLQLVEIMEAQQQAEVANEIRAVATNGGRRHKQLKNADEVEFWRSPDKQGWLHSQGEVIKTWRKRWFVLKDGFLFRFLDDNVTPSSKPRGIVDLSKAGEVTSGQSATNRPNSIKLGREKGFVVYLADSETEMVEWMSALEGTVSRLMRVIAGVDDEAPPASDNSARRSFSSSQSAFLAQAESAYKQPSHSFNPEPPRRSGLAAQGSMNYPGVSPPPTAPHVPSFLARVQNAPSGYGRHGTGGGEIYRDELGITYGRGTGVTIGGISGVAGVRAGGGGPSQLPSTISVSDSTYPSHAPKGMPHHDPYQSAGYQGSSPMMHHGHALAAAAPALPDTLNVVSIMDQAPTQQPAYGVGGATAHAHSYAAHAAVPPPQQQPQWELHYAPDGRPYYYNPRTQETSWEPR